MTESDYVADYSKILRLSRRSFLISLGSAAAGIVLLPSAPALASPVFSAVGKMAVAWGAAIGCEPLDKFIVKSGISKQTAREVKQANHELAKDSLTNVKELAGARVYFIATEPTYFFYLVKSTDKLNAFVVFFDAKRTAGAQKVAIVQGPTLFGIAELATRIALQKSPEVARETLLPREAFREAIGTLQIGYNQPDVYRSDAGTVRAKYETNGNGKGRVLVEVQDTRGVVLAEAEYELSYRV
ncbi:MAG: hypothetical protein AB1489_17815 [Acidobacteriota bacterium]